MSKCFTDSRSVVEGSTFFALKGERADGHDFLCEVANKGAKNAVVASSYSGPDFGLHLIPVDNVLKDLQEKAKQKLSQFKVRVVAVTGSVGKTTTKDFVATLLSQKFCISSSPGNGNSQVGLPLAILNKIQTNTEIHVQEMGMSQIGQISNLVQIAPPEVAMVTSVAYVHACNFNSLSDITKAKGEVFSSNQTKLGLLYKDHASYAQLCKMGTCRKESYSTEDASSSYYLNPKRECYERGKLIGQLPKAPYPGSHHDQNLMGAIAVARYFGMEWDQIFSGIEQLKLPERRFHFVEKMGIQFVNDSYNACSVSMKAALKSLPKPKNEKKKIAVLGEILELGRFSDICHYEVGEAALRTVDLLICFGEGCLPMVECWKLNNRPVRWTCDRNELMQIVRDVVNPGDVVLLKGSCGKQLWRVIDEL